MTETDAPTLAQILEVFEASGLEVSHDESARCGRASVSVRRLHTDGTRLEVWWDTSDPGNVGWAWELRRYDPEGDLVSDDSGGLDSIEELTGLLASLGTGEVKATEALGPTETPTPVNDIQAVHDEAMADLRRIPPAERAAVHQTKPNSADVGSELAALRADLDAALASVTRARAALVGLGLRVAADLEVTPRAEIVMRTSICSFDDTVADAILAVRRGAPLVSIEHNGLPLRVCADDTPASVLARWETDHTRATWTDPVTGTRWTRGAVDPRISEPTGDSSAPTRSRE